MSSPKIEERLKEKQIKAVVNEGSRLVVITEDECKKLCDAINVKFIPGYEKRVIERITSTEKPDRDGDIVRAKGIDNKNYRLNPVVLFSHDRYNFPIGSSIKEWIDKTITGWRSWDLYLDNTVDTTGKSDVAFRMIEAGILKGGSIGFIPKNNGAKYDHTDKERETLSLGKYGIEFISVEKIEHSVCSIPANAEALSASLKSCDIERIRKQLVKVDLDTMEKQKMIDENLIDVFYSVLQIPKTIIVPEVTKEIPKEEEMVINIDLGKAIEGITNLTKQMETFNANMQNIEKSITEKFKSLMEIADKSIASIKQIETGKSVFDKKDIEGLKNILKID